jgi:hypothetical protein
MRIFVGIALVLASGGAALGQGAVLQGGSRASGHAPMYIQSGSSGQTIVQDSGSAAGGTKGLGLSEQLIVARGTGSPPFASQGTGPLGTNWCNYDGPTDSAAGYHYFCLSANAQGGGLITYGAGGVASNLPLRFIVNGTTYQFPFSTSGVIGPNTSTVGRLALWNNTSGTLLAQDIPGEIKNTLTVNRNAATPLAGPSGTIFSVAGADGAIAASLVDGFGTNGIPVFNTRYARGTAASPSAVQANDILGILGGVGYGSTAYSLANVEVRFSAAQNFTDTAQGTRVSLFTTPNGSTGASLTEALRVDQDKSTTAFGLLKAGPTPSTVATDGLLLLSGNSQTLPDHDPALAANERWLIQMGLGNGLPGGFGIDTFGSFGVMDFRRANGTAAAPTALLSGDFLGVIGGLGYMTTRYSNGALQIRYYTSENWTDTANGSYMAFLTTPNGVNALGNTQEVLRLDQDRSANVFGPLVINPGVAKSPAVGVTLPSGPAGTVFHAGNTTDTYTVILADSYGATFPTFNTRRSRGSAASPTAVQSGDILGAVAGIGYGSTSYSLGNVQLQFSATENWNDGSQGTRASIYTTPNGSTGSSFAEALRIDQDKSVTSYGLLTVNRNASATLPAGPAGTQFQVAGANGALTVAVVDSFGAGGIPVINTRFARGTAVAPSAVQSGDIIGLLGGIGYGSTGYSLSGAQIRLSAAQTFTDAAQGSRVSIFTTPNGSSAASIAEALRIDQDKSVTSYGVLTVNRNASATPPTPSTGTGFAVVGVDGAVSASLVDSFGVGGIPVLNSRFARGTAAAPTAVQSGDLLGILGGIGYGATAYSLSGAQIRLAAAQNFTDAAQGTRVSIFTTPNGSSAASIAEAARFDQDKSATLFGTLSISGVSASLATATAIPAGGTAGVGYRLSSTTNFGVFFGSGVPTLSAAQGSIYLRSDGSSTSTRAYINTDGGTTWTAVTTAS